MTKSNDSFFKFLFKSVLGYYIEWNVQKEKHDSYKSAIYKPSLVTGYGKKAKKFILIF